MIDAVAYIEWGGQYDVRDLELIEWDGQFQYEDLTGGHMTIHNCVAERSSKREAKQALCSFLFHLGESSTYIDFGSEGIIRACDPRG